MRLGDLGLPDPQRLLAEAEVVQRDVDRPVVQDTHDGLLAMRGGHGRHTKIQRATEDLRTDAAVLRQATLGDVEVRHDLDA